mgnify:CR=1 FL=1
MREAWIQRDHPVWGKGGTEEKIHEMGLSHTFPKFQWRKGTLSIVGPASVLTASDKEVYELYNGKETYIFDSLEEAQKYGDSLT